MKIIHSFNSKIHIIQKNNGKYFLSGYRYGMNIKYELSKNQARKLVKYGKMPKKYHFDKFKSGSAYNYKVKRKPKTDSWGVMIDFDNPTDEILKRAKTHNYAFTNWKEDKILVRNFEKARNDHRITINEDNILNKLILMKIKEDIENNVIL